MKRINKFRALLCSCFAVAVLTMGCAMGASAKTSNFSEHTISAGTKMYYWSGDDYLSLPAYTKLTMNFQFNKSISSATGLRYSGYDVMNEAKNGNGKAKIYVNSDVDVLKEKAKSLDGYVRLFNTSENLAKEILEDNPDIMEK